MNSRKWPIRWWRWSVLLPAVWLVAACAPVRLPAGPGTVTPVAPPAATGAPLGPTPSVVATEPARSNGDVLPAAQAVRQELARRLNIPPADVKVVSVEAVEWPDACLGAAAPGEMCAQVLVPGYRLTLEAGGRTYVFHADQAGRQLRQVTGAGQPEATP